MYSNNFSGKMICSSSLFDPGHPLPSAKRLPSVEEALRETRREMYFCLPCVFIVGLAGKTPEFT
jgi:hypothetical protein